LSEILGITIEKLCPDKSTGNLEEDMECKKMTIDDLKLRYKAHRIELDPAYQRRTVWLTRDRRLLLASLFNGIPIPAVIFHKRFDQKKGKPIFDVLDGKQRIETILHFIGLKTIEGEKELSVRLEDSKNNIKDDLTYSDLNSKKVNKKYKDLLKKFWQYEIPVIEYQGEMENFFEDPVPEQEIFVRINSTGTPLTKNEIRHAHAVKTVPFFKLGEELEKRYEKFFEDSKITSKYQVKRYILHEFILELCTAIQHGDYSNRREKLEELLGNHQWKKSELTKLKNKFIQIINWIKEIFPEGTIKVTRFKNKSDFYSLFVVLSKLANKNYITKNKKDNKIAGKFLLTFSKQTQNLDPKIPNQKLTEHEENLREYFNAAIQATDRLKSRETRDKHLMNALKGGFFLKQKDAKRHFDHIVRDILWTELFLKSNNKPKCPNPLKNRKCKKILTYNDAEVDHKHPWAKGGHSKIENAQLLCSSCNSSKKDK
jgi:hypothetical protein